MIFFYPFFSFCLLRSFFFSSRVLFVRGIIPLFILKVPSVSQSLVHILFFIKRFFGFGYIFFHPKYQVYLYIVSDRICLLKLLYFFKGFLFRNNLCSVKWLYFYNFIYLIRFYFFCPKFFFFQDFIFFDSLNLLSCSFRSLSVSQFTYFRFFFPSFLTYFNFSFLIFYSSFFFQFVSCFFKVSNQFLLFWCFFFSNHLLFGDFFFFPSFYFVLSKHL